MLQHPDYNVRFFGLQKLHPFDSCKYEKIVAGLEQQGTIPTGSWISPTGEASRETLLSIHTAEYLDSLDNAATVAEICEVSPLAYLPNSTVRRVRTWPNADYSFYAGAEQDLEADADCNGRHDLGRGSCLQGWLGY